VRLATTPYLQDWAAVPLSDAASPLYYVIWPFRMIGQYAAALRRSWRWMPPKHFDEEVRAGARDRQMNKNHRAIFITAVSLALVRSADGDMLFAQALAPFRTYDRTLHVDDDHYSAADTNPGTPGWPLKTIGRAATVAVINNRNDLSTRVIIQPGTYRERVSLDFTRGRTDRPILFEGAMPGEVILSGSDVWSGWLRDGNTPVYFHDWPFNWGVQPVPRAWPSFGALGRRREMVFVNGNYLRQVLTRSEMAAGTFFVDETSGRIYLWPPESSDMARATIEVGIRDEVFRLRGWTNVTLRGLVFEHAASRIQQAAVSITNSSNITVEESEFRWNNWTGLGVATSNRITVRRSRGNNNGGHGISGYRIRGLLLEDTETSYNNWRGAWGGLIGWDPGNKFVGVHQGVVRRHTAIGNHARGMWFDFDNEHILIEESVFQGNRTDGIFIEANQGPFTVRASRFCGNGRWGILGAESSDVTIERVIVANNRDAQVWIGGHPDAPRPATNWETGQSRLLQAERWTLRDNSVVGSDPNQLVFGTGLRSNMWEVFRSSLSSDRNRWHNGALAQPFQVAGGRRLDFAGWQTHTGQDRNSQWVAAGIPDACQ